MIQLTEYIALHKPRRVLVVFPHPDDETMMSGGLIQILRKYNIEIKVVSLTGGGMGKIFVHGRGRSLVEIRTEELAHAMKILGVNTWEMRGMEDGKLRENPNLKQAVEVLIDEYEPEMIVTYDPSGITAHPDHITLSLNVIKAARKKGIVVLFPVLQGVLRQLMLDKRVARLHPTNTHLSLTTNYILSWKKWRALFTYKSQGMRRMMSWRPIWWLAYWYKNEQFVIFEPKRRYRYKYVKFAW